MHSDYDASEGKKRRFVQWAPEFNAGTASLILTIATGIFYFGGELSKQRLELDAVKGNAAAEAGRVKESITAIATDVRSIQTSLSDVKETLAVIKATQQANAQPAGKK